MCNGKVTDFGPKWSFLLIFTVFDLSRPPEGRYDPCVVLRRDNQVVYGVYQLYSTCNDNITLMSHQKVTDVGPKWSFLLILTVFDLGRPPEGRYDPCVVLRRENQVVYGAYQLYSTCNDNITLISHQKVTDFGPKWSFLLILTVFDLSRPPEGHYDPCVVLRHEKQVVYGVSQLYSTCNGPRRGHYVTENCPKM